MTSSEILRLAQEGNPKVITSLLNHVLKPYGVRATVIRHEIRLDVKLIATHPVDEAAIATLVRQVIQQLNVDLIPAIEISVEQEPPSLSGEKDQLNSGTDAFSMPPGDHNSVAWRQDETTSQPLADLSTEPVLPASFAESSVPPMMSAASMPEPSSSPLNPTSSPVPPQSVGASPEPPAADPSLNVFTLPPSGPLFENTSLASAADATEPEPSDKAIADIWQRPEAVIFVAYLLAVIVWQIYIDLTTSGGPDSGWTATALAERLGTSRTTLSRRKDREDFAAWTQSLDPDGLAWMYVGPRFTPVLGVDAAPAAPR